MGKFFFYRMLFFYTASLVFQATSGSSELLAMDATDNKVIELQANNLDPCTTHNTMKCSS